MGWRWLSGQGLQYQYHSWDGKCNETAEPKLDRRRDLLHACMMVPGLAWLQRSQLMNCFFIFLDQDRGVVSRHRSADDLPGELLGGDGDVAAKL